LKRFLHKNEITKKKFNAICITKPYGRFGNNFFQILNAIATARLYGFKNIFLPNFCEPFVSKSKNIKGIQFIFDSRRKYRYKKLEDIFFSSLKYKNNSIYYKFIAKNFLSKLLNINNVASRDLVIHIRSGDIFINRPHPLYIQPPLSFYKSCLDRIFKEYSISNVTLVYENLANPVISPLIKYLEFKDVSHSLVSSDIKTSIEVLMSARILIGGVGSFIAPAIIMSTKLRRLFISGYDQKLIAIAKASRIHTTLGFFENYIKPGEWANKDSQRKLMLDLPEKDVILSN
jgi:hypothetical protein